MPQARGTSQRADGGKDLYIRQDKYHAQFAADVPLADANLMATTQRPVTDSALNEPATTAAWKSIPSWFLYGSMDKNISSAVHIPWPSTPAPSRPSP